MRGLNKVMIIGQLGREPELRYTPGGKAVASFAVETRRDWTSPDGQRFEYRNNIARRSPDLIYCADQLVEGHARPEEKHPVVLLGYTEIGLGCHYRLATL